MMAIGKTVDPHESGTRHNVARGRSLDITAFSLVACNHGSSDFALILLSNSLISLRYLCSGNDASLCHSSHYLLFLLARARMSVVRVIVSDEFTLSRDLDACLVLTTSLVYQLSDGVFT